MSKELEKKINEEIVDEKLDLEDLSKVAGGAGIVCEAAIDPEMKPSLRPSITAAIPGAEDSNDPIKSPMKLKTKPRRKIDSFLKSKLPNDPSKSLSQKK